MVKSFEKHNFFDEGITKSQLFLSLHDAVLFALSRKLPEPSELSIDATETVIQETYSESDKNGNLRHKAGSSAMDGSQHVNPNYGKTRKPLQDDLDFDLDPMLTSGQSSGMALNLDLDLESELDPESEIESEVQTKPELESEFETDAQTELDIEETEPEPDLGRGKRPQPKTRTRASSPWRNYLSAYRFGSSGSQSRAPPHTRSVEKKQPRTHPNS